MNNKIKAKKQKTLIIVGICISTPIAITSAAFIGVSLNKQATLTINSYDSVDEPILKITQGIGLKNYGHYYSIYSRDRNKEFKEISAEDLKIRNDISEGSRGTYAHFVKTCKDLRPSIKEELKDPKVTYEAKEICNRRLKFISEVETTFGLWTAGITLIPSSVIAFCVLISMLIINIVRSKKGNTPRTIVVDSNAPKLVIKKSNS